MKILVTSDIHFSVKLMEKVFDNETFDAVVFLGDGNVRKVIEKKQISKTLFTVKGNRDIFSNLPKFLNFSLEGVRFFAMHGNIKGGVKDENLINYAEKNSLGQRPKVILFGHTHKQYSQKTNDFLLLNPGAIKNKEYAVLTLDDGEIKNAELKIFKN